MRNIKSWEIKIRVSSKVKDVIDIEFNKLNDSSGALSAKFLIYDPQKKSVNQNENSWDHTLFDSKSFKIDYVENDYHRIGQLAFAGFDRAITGSVFLGITPSGFYRYYRHMEKFPESQEFVAVPSKKWANRRTHML